MEQLRKWRLSRPDIQTLDAAGKMLGVSGVQVLRYETGEREIPASKAFAYAEITGIPAHVLCPRYIPAPGGKVPESALPAVWSANGAD